eukprot:g36187.t1
MKQRALFRVCLALLATKVKAEMLDQCGHLHCTETWRCRGAGNGDWVICYVESCTVTLNPVLSPHGRFRNITTTSAQVEEQDMSEPLCACIDLNMHLGPTWSFRSERASRCQWCN